MTSLQIEGDVRRDFDRIINHLIQHDMAESEARVNGILSAIDALVRNPLIGRPAGATLRELVIGRDEKGYIALYRYSEALDLVTVIALRAYKEAGYRQP